MKVKTSKQFQTRRSHAKRYKRYSTRLKGVLNRARKKNLMRSVRKAIDKKLVLKWLGLTITGSVTMQTNTIRLASALMPSVQQGDGDTQRVGNKIRIKKLRTQFYFSNASIENDVAARQYIRVMVWKPKAFGDAVSALAEMDQVFATAGDQSYMWHIPPYQQVTILADSGVFRFDENRSWAQFTMTIKNFNIQYANDAATSPSTYTAPQLYILFFTGTGATSGNYAISYTYTRYLSFHDD